MLLKHPLLLDLIEFLGRIKILVKILQVSKNIKRIIQ